MQQISTHNTAGPIDFDNLNIIIRPLPPQRRQSGISIIPFRPYVKRLTSVRHPFSYANGRDQWVTSGKEESFFKQENARCIGSLISDCGTSEVIRWDIEGESTRLPMMCKLWMIVDGAVVERGKPRMVQDAAVQVYTAGKSLRSIPSVQHQQYNQTVTTRYDRRRRHSWHDVNEYHSVPYFQYTSSIKSGYEEIIQCNFDLQTSTSTQEYLPFIEEETVQEHHLIHMEEHNAQESIHNHEVPQDRVQISMTTQTEHQVKTRSTSIDSGITLQSSLNVDTNEESTGTRDDFEYAHHSIGTGNDIEYSDQSVATRDDVDSTHHSIATGNDIEYSDQSVATRDDINSMHQSIGTGNDIEYSDQSVATHDDVDSTHHSVATGNDIEYSDQSVATRDNVDSTHHSIATGNDIEYSDQSVATHDDVDSTHHSIATGNDIEYSDQSVATRDDVDSTHHSIATGNDIEYSDQSIATHDDIRYTNQSVSTRDDVDDTHKSIATGNDVEYSDQSISTRDDIEHMPELNATRNDIEYSNQSVSTRDDIDDTHKSIATGNDIEYLDQSISTRDDIEYFDQSVATHDDIKYLNQSVSTLDDIEYTHQAVSTQDDIGYSHQSVATHDDITYANRSVSTRDDNENTYQSIATGNDTEYSTQSVSTRDDIKYFDRSVATQDDIEYSHQSVSTRDDLGYLNQSVSTRDDLECLNQSISTQDDIHYSSRSIATGNDYPDNWLQLTTNEILSEYITNPHEERELSFISPRQHDQSIQTETEQDTDIESEKPRSRSSRTPLSSSSVAISNHYPVVDQVDDEHPRKKSEPLTSHRPRIDSPGDLDSHFSDYQIETSSSRDSARSRRITSSSKQSDTGYNSSEMAFNQRTYSTPDLDNTLVPESYSTIETDRPTITRNVDNTPISSFDSLFERYEKTLRDRRQAMAVVNDQILDIDDLLRHYRERIREPTSTRAIQSSRNIITTPPKPREERPVSPVSSVGSVRSRYRFLSDDETTQEYIPSPRLYLPNPILSSPRQSHVHTHYCDICFTDHSGGSAWIRFNEQRLEQLQQRINLMLEFDDIEEAQLPVSTINSLTNSTTTTQRIDNILMSRPKRRTQIILPRRSIYRLPYRSNTTASNSSRLLSRNLTRSTFPASKRVRISTNDILIPNQTRLREPLSSSKSVSRPVVSILRRNNSSLTTRSQRNIETSLISRNNIDRRNYMIEQFTIPRYYRLYNDVGFREVYDFSRALDTYLRRPSSNDYSSMIQHYALEHQYPTPITSVA